METWEIAVSLRETPEEDSTGLRGRQDQMSNCGRVQSQRTGCAGERGSFVLESCLAFVAAGFPTGTESVRNEQSDKSV